MQRFLFYVWLVVAGSCTFAWRLRMSNKDAARERPRIPWKPFDIVNKIAINTVVLAGSALLISNVPLLAQAVEDNGSTTVQQLTAKEVLSRDLQPRVDVLKDIQFIFKLYPSYIDKQDYVALRQALRQEPTVQLRKTCISLARYLSATNKEAFNSAYRNMIDKLDTVDSVSCFARLMRTHRS